MLNEGTEKLESTGGPRALGSGEGEAWACFMEASRLGCGEETGEVLLNGHRVSRWGDNEFRKSIEVMVAQHCECT